LNRALDAYALRQQTIAKNIANSSSPHYRPEKVRFEEFFQEQDVVAQGVRDDGMHIPIGVKPEGEVMPEKELAPVPKPEIYFSGESHVNIDKEMSELAQNQIRFRFASSMVKKYFQGISSSIRGVSQ